MAAWAVQCWQPASAWRRRQKLRRNRCSLLSKMACSSWWTRSYPACLRQLCTRTNQCSCSIEPGRLDRLRRRVGLFDAIIMATPAQTAAALLRNSNLDLASELAAIQYTSSVTINLGYDGTVRAALPQGFGFLVPRSEGKRMLAATFVHNKFPHRAPEDRALLRCFVGGAHNEQILQEPDEELIRIIREDFRQNNRPDS